MGIRLCPPRERGTEKRRVKTRSREKHWFFSCSPNFSLLSQESKKLASLSFPSLRFSPPFSFSQKTPTMATEGKVRFSCFSFGEASKGEKRNEKGRALCKRSHDPQTSIVLRPLLPLKSQKQKTAYRVPSRRGVGGQQAPGRHRGHHRPTAKGRGAHQGANDEAVLGFGFFSFHPETANEVLLTISLTLDLFFVLQNKTKTRKKIRSSPPPCATPTPTPSTATTPRASSPASSATRPRESSSPWGRA